MSPQHLAVHLTSGDKLEVDIPHTLGAPINPLSERQYLDKFSRCCAEGKTPIVATRLATLETGLLQLEVSSNVQDIYDYDVEVPVLIIGAGATGLCAALAADKTSQVLVLEADARPYGSTGMSYGGICAAGSELQAAVGVEDDPQLLFEDIMRATKNQTDPDLARTLAFESAPAMNWLVNECGIELSVEKSWSGLGHSQPRMHAPELVGCAALILASCGFGGNEEMVAKHIPEIADAAYYGHESNRGDGIVWGAALGGVTRDMGSYQALGSLAYPQNLVIPHTLMIGGGIQVNLDGERFEDELENISGQALTILEQPQGLCCIVYDERLHLEAMQSFAEYRVAVEMRACKKAATLEELAAQLKLPASKLAESVALVEECKAKTTSCKFGRAFSVEQALKPPYYGIKVGAALFHTQGGLQVNSDARVIDENAKPLPNLFAGGGAACSVSGPGIWGYLPAMGLCTAVTLGKIAGSTAAKLTGEGL